MIKAIMKKISNLNKYIAHNTPKYQPFKAGTKKKDEDLVYSYVVDKKSLKRSIATLQNTVLKLQELHIIDQVYITNKYYEEEAKRALEEQLLNQVRARRRMMYNGYGLWNQIMNAERTATDTRTYISEEDHAEYSMTDYSVKPAEGEVVKKECVSINLTYIKKVKKLVIVIRRDNQINTKQEKTDLITFLKKIV